MSTFGEMKTAVAAELGLDTTASGTEDVLLGRWLNRGRDQLLIRTHVYVKPGTISISANDNEYELDSGILAIHDLKGADSRPIGQVSPGRMHDFRRSDSTSSVSSAYALEGANLLLIWPTPSEATTWTMYYVPRPTDMSASGHDPATATYGNIPSEYHHLIEKYALWEGSFYDGSSPPHSPDWYEKRFETELARMKGQMNRKGGRRLPPARPGRRPRVPSHPSQDLRW